MEDSFRVRLDRAFGSLPLTTTTSTSSSLTSLWSLTDDEINTAPSDRTNRTESEPEPEPEPEPYQSWSSGAASSSSSSSFRVELEKDLEDLDEDEEEGFRRAPSNPDDYDDEQWQIRSGIGLDCTLDYEEEEDHYDKQAIGKENQGDRVYMKDIADDGVEIDNCNSLPTTFGDYVRDPRANHLAARMRLKQDDDEAAKKIDGLRVSDDNNKSAPDIDGDGDGDGVNPKSILKSNHNHPSEHKSQKRVRFDPEFDDRGNEDEHEASRDVRMRTTSMEEEAGLDQSSKSKEFALAVPDYIRNPSRYTRYSFDDSPSDMDDKSNKQAYMSFLSQLKGSNGGANGTGSQNGALDDLPAVTFISKKKSGDITMGENEMVSKQKTEVGKEHRRGFTVSIVAGESESSHVCAMEEDEPEAIEDVRKSSLRLNRKYRKKTQEDDPTA